MDKITFDLVVSTVIPTAVPNTTACVCKIAGVDLVFTVPNLGVLTPIVSQTDNKIGFKKDE